MVSRSYRNFEVLRAKEKTGVINGLYEKRALFNFNVTPASYSTAKIGLVWLICSSGVCRSITISAI